MYPLPGQLGDAVWNWNSELIGNPFSSLISQGKKTLPYVYRDTREPVKGVMREVTSIYSIPVLYHGRKELNCALSYPK